ncbi:helix-turn-helix transcriptional regulator [Frondihabitans australicus]|uniref:Regulatory LuxR family protein n=1 Tax=Frondihabitans australicus TaxID=386892 RepID=A0A495ILM2_9MICO|nr:helix-turn-helix transcriptional regulator [Frondihabitans australicus]RKR76328.1 regulatory LuxR family protein [Frondihabitans australicus]
MTIEMSAERAVRGPVQADEAFARALHPSSTFLDRFVIVEGGTGFGKSFALAGAAAAARSEGLEVVQMRAHAGDPVISASSLEPLMSLWPVVAPKSEPSGSANAPGMHVDAASVPRPLARGHVVLVDDFHHLERAAQAHLHAILTHVVRNSSAVCVVAVDDRRLIPGWNDLPHVFLRPLDVGEAEQLLRENVIDLPPARRRMLTNLAQGNPMILHAVGRAWAAQSSKRRSAIFPASYPRLDEMSGSSRNALESLSNSARTVVLKAAVATVEFAGIVPPFIAEDSAAIGDALNAGVLIEGDNGPEFADPVTRAIVLSQASEAELTEVRTVITACEHLPRRFRILVRASSATQADDALAGDLVAVAGEALEARRPHEAVNAYLQAARLSKSRKDKQKQLARAADIAGFIGAFPVLEDVTAKLATPDGQVPVDMRAGFEFAQALCRGEVRESKRNILAALAQTPRMHSATGDALTATLQILCFLRGDNAWWDEAVGETATRDVDPILRVVEDCLQSTASPANAPLYDAARQSAADGEPWKFVSLHVAWSILDATDPRRDWVEQLMAGTGNDDDLLGLFRMCRTGVAAFQRGRLDEAVDAMDKARATALRYQAGTVVALADAFQALVFSVQGHPDRASATADRASQWALRHGAPLVARSADHARSSLDLSLGRFEDAHARSTAKPPVGGHWIEHGYGPVELLDAVESAARLRMPAHGLELIRAAEAALGSRRAPKQTMIVTASRAIIDERTDARALFESALSLVEPQEAPFEIARIRLAYGEWLRRTMHALEARTQFRLAAAAFEALGAEQWRQRAQSELRVAGGASGPTPASLDGIELSEQEQRVASLAAAGLSNKQIANQLFLSPRTVSGHLYRIFPKLGVTARAGLRDALLGLNSPEMSRGA